jgi:hypothetical protein
MQRLSRIFRLLALLSIAISASAVFLATRGEGSPAVRLMIAAALTAGLAVLLGSALMTFVLLSSRNGHDQVATPHTYEEGKDE